MEAPAPKRARLCIEEVMLELDNEDDDGPMTVGSDDEFEDITFTEQERDEWGIVAEEYNIITESSTTSLSMTAPGDSTTCTSLPPVMVPRSSPPTLPHSVSVTVPGDSSLPLSPSVSVMASEGSTLPLPSAVSAMAPGGSTLPLPPVSVMAPEDFTPPLSVMAASTPPFPPSHSVTPLTDSQTGQNDPFSLPLSHYFSLPLSTLISLLQSAMTLPHTPAPTLTSVDTQRYTPPIHRQPPVVTRQPTVSRPPPTQPGPSSRNTTLPSGWTSTLSPVDIAPFVQPVGPTVPIPQSELGVFTLFFNDEICKIIVEQTNLYAEQVLGEKYMEWEKISVQELRAYFGFMVLMGLVPLPAIDDYWRRDPLMHYSPIADRISRKRFREIHRFLHFADNTSLLNPGEPGYDRLGKVKPMIEKLQDRFLNLYLPHCENSIDEAMIPFQGRSTLKQYMPAKPIKRGIKVWCRADAHNGYMSEIQVYTGRSDSAEGGLGKRVVLDLAKRLEGKKYHLYFDNFFSSVSLLETLLGRGLYACGTARQNYRDFPETLKMRGKSKTEMERHGLVNR